MEAAAAAVANAAEIAAQVKAVDDALGQPLAKTHEAMKEQVKQDAKYYESEEYKNAGGYFANN